MSVRGDEKGKPAPLSASRMEVLSGVDPILSVEVTPEFHRGSEDEPPVFDGLDQEQRPEQQAPQKRLPQQMERRQSFGSAESSGCSSSVVPPFSGAAGYLQPSPSPSTQLSSLSDHDQRQQQINEATPFSAAEAPMESIVGITGSHQTPDFLYQLTKMLTDDNREIIEWSYGKIEVHSPLRLETEVLQKYFRHNKFASFQRQLNYFGFRKQTGKGKMSPCSYVNDNLPSNDLSCLVHIKKKIHPSTSVKGKEKLTRKKNIKVTPAASLSDTKVKVNPVFAGFMKRSVHGEASISETVNPFAGAQNSVIHQAAIAQAAVGRGIRHGFGVVPQTNIKANPEAPTPDSDVRDEMNFASSTQLSQEETMTGRHSLPDFFNSTDRTTVSLDMATNPLSELFVNYQNTVNGMMRGEANSMSMSSIPTNIGPPSEESALNEVSIPSATNSLVDIYTSSMLDGNTDFQMGDSFPRMDKSTPNATDEFAGGGDDGDTGYCFIDFPEQDDYPSSAFATG